MKTFILTFCAVTGFVLGWSYTESKVHEKKSPRRRNYAVVSKEDHGTMFLCKTRDRRNMKYPTQRVVNNIHNQNEHYC